MKMNLHHQGELALAMDFNYKILLEEEMRRKFFISLLVVSFLNYVGCYSSEIISKAEIDQGTKKINFDEEISISTKDYNSYRFGAHQFQIENDTLYGTGVTSKLGNEVPFKGKIAMNDITSIEQKSMDAGATTGLIIGGLVLGALIAVVVVVAAFTSEVTPD